VQGSELTRQYQSVSDFRQALETRLRKQEGDLTRLRRKVAFDRFLARLFHQNNVPWLLKGGYAMELRLQNRARSTKDMDLSIPDTHQLQVMIHTHPNTSKADLAFEALQQVAELNLDDYFEFQIRRLGEDITIAPEGGIQCQVECRLGKEFTKFHLDVGFGDAVTGSTDWIQGNSMLDFAEIPPAKIAMISVAQQFAEKVHACTQQFEDRPNTRDKDLIDLVLILETFAVDPNELRQSLVAVFEHRDKQSLPLQFPEPPEQWRESFEAKAEELALTTRTLAEAHQLVANYWNKWNLGQQN
jgi:hypothetical protein